MEPKFVFHAEVLRLLYQKKKKSSLKKTLKLI